MATPVVSVVIPAYRSPYLRDAIESVQAQTFSDFEIIVVDDGSPEPLQIGGCLCLRQANQRPAAARNTGIRAAHGVYVAFLDSDDSWEPTYLEEQLTAIRKDQGSGEHRSTAHQPRRPRRTPTAPYRGES